MGILEYFAEELINPQTSYFIFDTKGSGIHGDIDFKKYEWSPSKYNLAKEGDVFIYRRPRRSSVSGEFYFFGACKIGKLNLIRNDRYEASFSKAYPFNEPLRKSDLEGFKWVWKTRSGTWQNFFNQYGMNKITKTDFENLLRLSEPKLSDEVIDTESEIMAIQSIQRQDYSAEDSISETKVRSQQKAFSDKIKLNYGFSCAVCGMKTKELLVGSHIIPWAKRKDCRLDPGNGICLCVLHDKAFDCGYITVDTVYQLKVSKSDSIDGILMKHLAPFDGRPIQLPRKDKPKTEYLSYHQTNIFIR